MRRSLATSIYCSITLSAAFAATVQAQTAIISNGPVATTKQGAYQVRDGSFSDALSSNGGDYYSQAIAQGFSLSGGATISSIDFWGASEYVTSTQPWTKTALSTNVNGFQITLFKVNDNGTMPQVANWTIAANAFTQQLTGTYTTTTLSPIFKISAALSGATQLTAGKYAITVGGRLINPNGDAFAWIDGQWDGSGGSTQSYITVGDIPSQWGTWLPLTDGTSGAFSLYGSVPAPGALALIGLAGLCSRRRRS